MFSKCGLISSHWLKERLKQKEPKKEEQASLGDINLLAFFWNTLYWIVSCFIFILGSTAIVLLPEGDKKRLLKERLWPKALKKEPLAWFHSVSLGEAVILNTVLSQLKIEEKRAFLLTASTHSGYSTLKTKNPGMEVRFMPFDFPWCLRRLFRSVGVPDLLIVETEIWPNLFRLVTRAGKRIMVFNARLSEKTLKHANNALIASSLKRVELFSVRSTDEETNLIKLGIPCEKIRVLGNIKFDYGHSDLSKGLFRSWCSKEKLVIFSSISNDEVGQLAPVAVRILKEYPEYRLLWVPRHFDQLENHSFALSDLGPRFRSTLDEGEDIANVGRCMILDTMGELSGTYRFGLVSVIGGSFNKRGGQNFLESLAVGTPALVGPNMHNFKVEIQLAVQYEAVIQVGSPQELLLQLREFLRDPGKLEDPSAKAGALMARNRGALAATVKEIRHFLKQDSF